MEARFRQMTETEYPRFEEECIRLYVDKRKRSEGFPESAVEPMRAESKKTFLSDGLATKDQFFYVLDVEGYPRSDLPGWLWLAKQTKKTGSQSLFVYDLFIRENLRGKGYGEMAMRFVEAEARRLGLPKIQLHVFGHNRIARNLYEKLGFVATNVQMEKTVPLPGT